MTPGTRLLFFLLLLLLVLTGPKSVTLSQNTKSSAGTSSYDSISTPITWASASRSATPIGTSAPATSSSTEVVNPAVHTGTSAPASTSSTETVNTTAHRGTLAPAATSSTEAATPAVHTGTSAPASTSFTEAATPAVHTGTSAPASTSSSSTEAATPAVHTGNSAPASTSSTEAATPAVHTGTSASVTSSASDSATTPPHNGSSAVATTSLSPNYPSPTSTTLPSPSNRTIAGSTSHNTVPPSTSSNHSSPQLSVMVSLFSLSFEIVNLQFNSSLEDSRSPYYQELKENIYRLFFQIYQQDFLGILNIIFRQGSVAVESTLIFRKNTNTDDTVRSGLTQLSEAAKRYNLLITDINAREIQAPSSTAQSGVPGWGIALLVLVCVLVLLAIVYYIALAVCQCRRKSYGHLDIFPTRDTYHPMSEYPTYHTHGRYVPPGTTRRSPYEEVSTGNGGGSLSYTNPAMAATSANL